MSIHVHVRQRNFGWAMGGRGGLRKMQNRMMFCYSTTPYIDMEKTNTLKLRIFP